MTLLNRVLGASVGAALSPFQSLPPIVGLLVVSLVSAIAMLLVFRATSNQSGIAAVKRRIHAGIFEIRLFNDDLRTMFKAQGDILRHNLSYLRLSFAPMLWMLVPLLLLIAQLQFYYGFDGLRQGAPALVKVKLKESVNASAMPSIALAAPAGLQVQTPPVWIPSEREVAWRIAAERDGDYQMTITLDGRHVTKQVRASNQVGWRAPERLERGFLNQLLYPAEPPIDADIPIEAIYVSYPERDISLFGWNTHWMIAFFVLSLVIAFALKKPFGVVI